jgi:hypothetical protein
MRHIINASPPMRYNTTNNHGVYSTLVYARAGWFSLDILLNCKTQIFYRWLALDSRQLHHLTQEVHVLLNNTPYQVQFSLRHNYIAYGFEDLILRKDETTVYCDKI